MTLVDLEASGIPISGGLLTTETTAEAECEDQVLVVKRTTISTTPSDL